MFGPRETSFHDLNFKYMLYFTVSWLHYFCGYINEILIDEITLYYTEILKYILRYSNVIKIVRERKYYLFAISFPHTKIMVFYSKHFPKMLGICFMPYFIK